MTDTLRVREIEPKPQEKFDFMRPMLFKCLNLEAAGRTVRVQYDERHFRIGSYVKWDPVKNWHVFEGIPAIMEEGYAKHIFFVPPGEVLPAHRM